MINIVHIEGVGILGWVAFREFSNISYSPHHVSADGPALLIFLPDALIICHVSSSQMVCTVFGSTCIAIRTQG